MDLTPDSEEIDRINLKSLLKHAHIGVVIHRLDTSIVYANPTALKLLDMSYNQVIGRDAYDPSWYFIDEYQQKIPIDAYPVKQVLNTGMPLINEMIGQYSPTTREVNWFLVNAYPEVGEEFGDEGFVVVTFNEISARRHLFSYRDVIENTRDVVIVTDAEGIEAPFGPQIVFVNRAFEELTGFSSAEAIGETPRILQGHGTDAACRQRIREALQAHQPIRETILNYSKSGKPYWLDMDIFPLRNQFGKVTHFAAIERDVTDQTYYADQLSKRNEDLRHLKQSLEKLVSDKTKELRDANYTLQRLALYDDLTGIPNRRCFLDQFKKQCAMADRYEKLVAIGMIDLDHFKKINDQYGHDAGDAVLKETAQYFRNFFRAEDSFGRMGGEEFAFAVLVGDAEAAESMCRRLVSRFAELPVTVDGQDISVTMSAGVYVAPSPTQEISIDDALRKADTALYEAKKAGRNQAVRWQK